MALTQQQDGLIPQLLTKMNVDPGTFEAAAAEKVSQLPHVTGSGRDPDKVYISNELDQALTAAEKQAQQMKDEYISVEHVFMGMLQRPGRVLASCSSSLASHRKSSCRCCPPCAATSA